MIVMTGVVLDLETVLVVGGLGWILGCELSREPGERYGRSRSVLRVGLEVVLTC